MAPDEHERELLRRKLAELLGDDAAGLLMERLPPQRWDQLATTADVGALRQDVDLLRQDVDHIRQDVDHLREEMLLRLDSTKHELLAAFRGELTAAVTSQTRTMIFTMAGSLVALASLSMTLGRVG